MKGKGSPPFALPDRYESQDKVLSGGQGDVYIYRDKSLDRLVAVKVLRGVKHATALTKEIQARAKIKSKHVAELYDRITDRNGDPVGIVMEYVPGDSLDHGSARPSSGLGVLRLLYQLACGIADIHAAGVIHRDIKPSNMKVDDSGVLKIFDLGIANIDASSASTVGGAGTYAFRAPELYRTLPRKVTPEADVYAIGVTAWWFLGNTIPPALLTIPPQRGGHSPPSLDTVITGRPQLSKLLDGTLDVDPDRRPSCIEVRDCISRELVKGQRRGVFSMAGKLHDLTKIGTSANVQIRPYGSMRVSYSQNGRFVIREVVGDVSINNAPATVGQELPDSCVITFGPIAAGARRVFVPFNVSQPETVL